MSNVYSFRGGVHFTQKSPTLKLHTERFKDQIKLCVPLFIPGEPDMTACVKAGDTVLRGQEIGIPSSDGCSVHSPVSGTVEGIVNIRLPSDKSREIPAIEIFSDGKMENIPLLQPFDKKLSETTPEEIADVLKAASVVNLNYDGTAVYRKILAYTGKIRRLIINCSETEPFHTNTLRLMFERPADIIGGIKILMRAFAITGADIIMADSEEEADNSLLKACGKSKYFKIRIFESRYPLSDPALLTKAMIGYEVGPGTCPEDFGCTVLSAETCAAVYHAFAFGLPLVERRITVSGESVTHPKNLLVPFGISYTALIDKCDGIRNGPCALIDGNPLTGICISDYSAPVTASTSAVLLVPELLCRADASRVSACINCGRCSAVCPRRLLPSYIAAAVNAGNMKKAVKLGAEFCSECGLCSYVCPAHSGPMNRILQAKNSAVSEKEADR